VFLEYGDLVAEKARLNLQLDGVDRAAKQRSLEYEKSMQMHPEFQSVPELQNRFRGRLARDIQRLEEQQRSHEERYVHAADKIASQILDGLPLADMKARLGEGGGDTLKEVKPELASLRDQMNELKDSFKLQLAHLQNKQVLALDARTEEYTSQLTHLKNEQVSKFATQRDEYTTILEKQQLAFKQQMDQMRMDMLVAQAEREQRQREEFKAQFSKYEEQIKTLVQAQDTTQALSMQAQASTDGLASLRTEHAGLKSDLSALSDRVDGLARQLAQYKDEIKPLRESIDECSASANKSLSLLSSVDLEGVDQIAEVFVGAWPTLQNKVADHERRIEEVAQGLQSVKATPEPPAPPTPPAPVAAAVDPSLARTVEQASATAAQVKRVQEEMGTLWGGMLDDLDERMGLLTTRTAALEELAANLPRSPPPDVDLIKGTTDKLGQDFVKLTEKVEVVNDKMEQKCEYLNHQFTTLDSQYNNLSTKALAEHIIAQMEVFYPKNAQIVADIDMLSKTVQELKRRWTDIGNEQATLRHALLEISSHVNPALADMDPKGNKKRRIDAGPTSNGTHHQANGTSLPG